MFIFDSNRVNTLSLLQLFLSEVRNYTTLLNTRLTFVELKQSDGSEAALIEAHVKDLITAAINDHVIEHFNNTFQYYLRLCR